jgi:hypothetical protein
MTSRLFPVPELVLMACLSVLPATGMCAKDTVPANIHSVNYSGEEFTYWLEDPLDSKNRGDGESVGPYKASGIMCCYSLPRRWRSGILVKIHATHSFKKTPDAELSEIAETQVVEVPPYVDGKVGEIWVLRAADGALSIVSSDYQPDHEKWPGKIKGWPVPSLEYRRARWDLYIEGAEGNVKLYQDLLLELNETPEIGSQSAWNSYKKNLPEIVRGFTGPKDKKFLEYLHRDYEKSLTASKAELHNLKSKRP